MTQETKDVNSSLQLTPDMIAFLEKQKTEAEAKALAEKQRQEAEVRRKATLDSLESQGVLKTLEAGGIRDMLKNKPELLDNPVALETALENAKLKLESSLKDTQRKPASDLDESGAERPAGGSGERHIPEYGTPEFFAAMSEGKLTDADIDSYANLRQEHKELLKQSLPRPNETKEYDKFFK